MGITRHYYQQASKGARKQFAASSLRLAGVSFLGNVAPVPSTARGYAAVTKGLGNFLVRQINAGGWGGGAVEK